jgi:filamin
LTYVNDTGENKVTILNEKNVAVPFKLTDNNDKTYRVEFEATTIGFYTVTVTFAGKPTPGSPYKVKVESGVDISKVEVTGLPESK